jgi:hypothetical protein
VKRILRSRLFAVVVSCGITAAVVGGFAMAAIPNGNTINACRNKTTFVLRVIDKDLGQTCTSNETALSWSSWSWKGPYISTTTYKIGDVVRFNGSSYLARTFNPPVGTPPTNTTYWALVASKGDTGQQGPPGDTGQQGPPGADSIVGELYSAVEFAFRSTGCPQGEYMLAASTIAGASLSWTSSSCSSPRGFGSQLSGILFLRVEDLPTNGVIADSPGNGETGFLTARYFSVNGQPFAMRCSVLTTYPQLGTPGADSAFQIVCDLIADTGDPATARARIDAMIAAGVRSTPLTFRIIP